ncbi:hypothetical protein [Aquidulcibacter sp.]|uniref:hypothetical protein n=1 Tax=Aquidulcibacter sp. TaxID=2052990 RepID=UPI0025C0949B|nr:hypothetical protein [Aquidulcibacter sp.]MCA3697558.1 hypothetical protein [Aquidulcibacter sp.]
MVHFTELQAMVKNILNMKKLLAAAVLAPLICLFPIPVLSVGFGLLQTGHLDYPILLGFLLYGYVPTGFVMLTIGLPLSLWSISVQKSEPEYFILGGIGIGMLSAVVIFFLSDHASLLALMLLCILSGGLSAFIF